MSHRKCVVCDNNWIGGCKLSQVCLIILVHIDAKHYFLEDKRYINIIVFSFPRDLSLKNVWLEALKLSFERLQVIPKFVENILVRTM